MLTHLECTRCGEHYAADRPQTVCLKDGGILYARYDLPAIKKSFSSARLAGRTPTMWRYDAILPEADPVSLGEGFTPMLPSREYSNVFIKDEGLNPTGSFKARGLSAAVTMARHFGLKKLAIPSAGNAAGALAAYAAAAGLEAHIFMPKDVPMANRIECDFYGANVTLIDGLISDCAKKVAELKDPESWKKDGWFDVSTTKEPYRVEGKKTMGYEVARTTRLEDAPGNHLSHRWRCGPARYVEGLRRDGIPRLDRLRTPQDDQRAGRRLRPDRQSLE